MMNTPTLVQKRCDYSNVLHDDGMSNGVMALQAGLPPLDFSPLTGRGRRAYIAGIHAALSRDYRPLAAMFGRVIARSQRRAASSAR